MTFTLDTMLDYPGFAACQLTSGRTIPVIPLVRRGGPAPGAGA